MLEELQQTVISQAEQLDQSKQKIKDNQARYYRLLNAIHEVYYSANMEGNVTEISPSIGTVAGYDCREIVGSPVTSFYKHPEDRVRFMNELMEKGFVTDYELALIHKNGQEVHVSANAHVMLEDGRPCGVEGMLRDISDRVRLERELQALNDQLEHRVAERTAELERKNMELLKFSQAIEQAAEGFIITDCEGLIEYVNPAFEKINGYGADEVMGRTLSILNSGKHEANFFHDLWIALRAGGSWEGTIINRRKDGSEYPALMTIVPITHDGEIDFYAAIQQDMSEHEKLESQFQQAQKMEAIGTLAGGIAHDFNNMLSGIMMHLYMAKQHVHNPDQVLDKLDKAERMGFQASDILKDLMIFSRKESGEQKPLELNRLLKESFQLLRISIPNRVELKLDVCAEPLLVMGNVTQLQQVLMNLLNNGRDALQHCEKARLTISLRVGRHDRALIARHPQLAGTATVEMVVSDNGGGIAKDDLKRIFEPFYTTKAPGHGTGLGLAMVYGCIKSHAGAIEVSSTPGEGTSFHIYLPVIEAEADEMVS